MLLHKKSYHFIFNINLTSNIKELFDEKFGQWLRNNRSYVT